ncbi:protease inhibitor Inh/omp19 family protein [Agrobacterium sp. ES01]|uniref:protease inhibitor Inh/omp19 family protein n=1 Tax=Agrobacterium sp. ES01 TaxID=3420714 RepID=UPI003D0A18C9
MEMKYAAAGLMIGLSLAGCQRTSYSGYNNSEQALPPLQAQPVPTVESGQLPDPTMANPTQFPQAPADAAGAIPATAQDVTKEQMVGNWRVANGAANCDMFLTLTNLGSGSRGGTRGCVGPLTTMGSWEVAGKQVVLKDRNGNVIGRVYKTADARFDGTTNTGQPISLSR